MAGRNLRPAAFGVAWNQPPEPVLEPPRELRAPPLEPPVEPELLALDPPELPLP
jgi:hypothetical protein